MTALLAAVILLYVGWWLHDKSHAKVWQSFIERHMRDALQRGTLWALAGLSLLAVYREVDRNLARRNLATRARRLQLAESAGM